jgi:hypothetical protein
MKVQLEFIFESLSKEILREFFFLLKNTFEIKTNFSLSKVYNYHLVKVF